MAITATGKKKDGLMIYRVRVYVDGVRRERRAFGLQEAKRIENELTNKEPEGITVGELADLYSKSRAGENRKTTIAKADQILRTHVLPEFANKSAELSIPDLSLWKAEIGQKNLSLATKQNIYVAFSALLNYGVKMELIQKNNLRVLGNFRDSGDKPETEKLKFYTAEQFRRFIAALPTVTYSQRRDHCFFMMAFFTGARKGELNALKWTDLEGDLLHIRRSVTQTLKGVPVAETATKNKSSKRDIRLPAQLIDYLNDWHTFCAAMPGFSEEWRICGGHTIIHDSHLFTVKRDAAKKAGLPEIAIHDFRHSHATLLINSGVNIKEISRRLGHASVEMTWNVYAHLYPSQEDKALEVLESVLT